MYLAVCYGNKEGFHACVKKRETNPSKLANFKI